MTKIKLCGLTTMDDIMAVNVLLPDYAGFVFAPGRRSISPELAATFKKALFPGIQAVGVFVNASLREMAELANQGIIDVIQLHGDEIPADITALKSMTAAPVIKAVRVKNREDILSADNLPCDFLLFDTYTKGVYGGSGCSFDWSWLTPMKQPYFLAGGLQQSNITAAAQTPACCLDISSGVETDGRKDPGKMKQIIETIRRL